MTELSLILSCGLIVAFQFILAFLNEDFVAFLLFFSLFFGII